VLVQLELPFLRSPPPPELKLLFVRVRRARKYILRVRSDGTVRVTIPRGGSRQEAERFVSTHRQWVEQEHLRVAAQHAPLEWHAGDTITLRGEPVVLRVDRGPRGSIVHVGDQRVQIADGVTDLRPAVEAALRRIAARSLVPRLHELAARHDLHVTRVAIRNQRSRWGSCSRSGVIALNFRLVQMLPSVCDYVLLHELMHLRQPNHSRRFWRLIEQVCPDFREAERWLRMEGRTLF
jgi:predicted metal-dependent hydrolase